MELLRMKIPEITPYGGNPRLNDDAVEAVAESIMQCGYIAPIIVDEYGMILAGHTRYKALKKLGRTEAEVVVKAGLTEDQKRKYRLLDNKTNELASWDFELLEKELKGLDFEGFDFGFDVNEEGEPVEIIDDDPPEIDEGSETACKLGDVWQLGRHRLVCGDSTNAETFELLMGGQSRLGCYRSSV